jgi:hypothetical protein
MVTEEKPPTHQKTRIISVVAATAIALACGTNVRLRLACEADANKPQYAYSAWAPQFADKLQLSATQSNVVVCNTNLISNIPRLTMLGNRCEFGHVCFGHTYGYRNG